MSRTFSISRSTCVWAGFPVRRLRGILHIHKQSLPRTPAAYTFDRGYPPYLASSWAAVAQIRIAGPLYTNIGVYENEPVAATTNHGGFPGPDWGLNYANGATFPVQFGYRTTEQN